MEVFNQIRPLPQPHCKQDLILQSNEFTLDVLERETGYFEDVIRPLLMPGHEGELVGFFQNMGLIPQLVKCSNASADYNCNKPLIWLSSRSIDNYNWKCTNCKKMYSIKRNSIFHDVKCNFKDLLRIVLGWCKGQDSEDMMKLLGVQKQTVNFIYKICVSTAIRFIKSNISAFQLGGPDIIVIVDVYPDGYHKFCADNEIPRTIHPILCIAEVKEQPPRYWFEVLNQKTKKEKHEVALQALRGIIRPGTTLVCDMNAPYCSYASLQALKHIYPSIISIDALSVHNTESQGILTNLKSIWEPAMHLCEESRNFNQSTSAFLTQKIWRNKFGRNGFEVMLNHFCNTEM